MERLVQGFRRWRESYFEEHRSLFTALAQNGQAPKVLLVGCCDSRVDPGLIFGAQPGEMFVLRNVANLVPPYAPDGNHHGTSAALEFAVRVLAVEHIIVLGHAHCGGVRALLDAHGPDDTDFIRRWMDIARGARDRALALALSARQPKENAQRLCEQETVALSLGNLMSFPWVRERVEQGQLVLHGWWFDLDQGELFHLDAVGNTFLKV